MFTVEEYQERMRKTKEKMNEQGIEVLLLVNPSNMNYLSGYDAWSFYVHQMIIVMIDEEQPIWIGREMDANSARISTWMNNDNIIPYPDDYIQSDNKHPMEFVANILKEIGQANRYIGVEMETHYFSALSYLKLIHHLPNATFKDADQLVNWVRSIKSPQEITYMRMAAQNAEMAMRRAYETIDANVRECDVAANIFQAQISGTAEHGGDYPAIVPMIPSGRKTSAPHFTWTDERYQVNDPVIVELAGCYNRYHSPLARTMVIGEPSYQLAETSKVIVEALNETLNFIRPGVTSEEIEEVWQNNIAKHGFYKRSRLGYSVGLSYPPDWGEHTISIRPGDQTVIQPNMTLHLIPGLWYHDFGVEISEAIRVTDSGCETLADFPRELYVKNPTPSLYVNGTTLPKY
ncbi:M24 family metallopeptidase [Virgibacillus sp. MSP4-1]|uniref:M24 family metallopeptidase n=1 Tax=Virgibacillus sp. MSP4-1 TaxID=2700081 RepID=UPI0003A3ECAA|nr:M24 family metallopeptidase [Virgibacillus sp. MSP4-1]QHS23169.1 M24 family metallopeptidase [Virgibacillus sp. MSP4-1]